MANPFLPPSYESLGLARFADPPKDDQPQPKELISAVPREHVSALSGLTVQQILDSSADYESFSQVLEEQHALTKKAILEHFTQVKTRLGAQREAAVEDEAQAGARRLAAKQAEVDLLRFELHQSSSRVQMQDLILRRTAAAYDQVKQQKRTQGLMLQCFYSWRQHALQRKQRRMRHQRGLYWYHVEHLRRHVLREWYKVAMQLRRDTLARQAEARQQEAIEQTSAQLNTQIDTLRRQLQESHVALMREQEARERLEDNMKQAFMRGVTALNLEAMSLMKRNTTTTDPTTATTTTTSVPTIPAAKQLPLGSDTPAGLVSPGVAHVSIPPVQSATLAPALLRATPPPGPQAPTSTYTPTHAHPALTSPAPPAPTDVPAPLARVPSAGRVGGPRVVAAAGSLEGAGVLSGGLARSGSLASVDVPQPRSGAVPLPSHKKMDPHPLARLA